MFPTAHQWFLEKLGLDDQPVLVEFTQDKSFFKEQFRFDKRWVEDPSFLHMLTKAWNHDSPNSSSSFNIRAEHCRQAILDWKTHFWSNSARRIRSLRKALQVQNESPSPCFSRIRHLKSELAIAFREEEIYWRQRSTEKWLHDGDKNTGVFHACVNSTRSTNTLHSLIDNSGVDQFSEKEKGEVAVQFFTDLFKSSVPPDLMNLLGHFHPRVSSTMNADLCRLVSIAEIREAAFSISGDNAPGPDGLTGFFFQQFWDLVKHQIISEVQGFFSTGILPATWNHTNLCLIPKIPAPNRMTNLRPINLCSVLYQIISKILINRLKRHLPNIISPTQAAFVSETIITDNIMIAHEVVHSLHSHPEISKSSVLLKTDMSKAYDRLEWPFLEGILQVMGFAPLWISWIMGCVTSVTFSVLINGHPYGFIKPERGIRQGDPLSPFLFVISTEALIHLFNQAEINGSITGI